MIQSKNIAIEDSERTPRNQSLLKSSVPDRIGVVNTENVFRKWVVQRV